MLPLTCRPLEEGSEEEESTCPTEEEVLPLTHRQLEEEDSASSVVRLSEEVVEEQVRLELTPCLLGMVEG
jgi:hypothetical protein